MDVTTALTTIEKSNPQEAGIIQEYLGSLNKSVVELGTDHAFALKDNDGEIRAFRQNLQLAAQNGGLIQPLNTGSFVISAQGYDMWADAAGATAIFPKQVIVHGQMCLNPYAERDPKTNRIIAVHARAIAFRFSSKGIPQVSDWSTIFDTQQYRMIDLLAKAKKLPQAFKLLPRGMEPVPQGMEPVPQGMAQDNGPVDGTWGKYPFDETMNLWVNSSHPEALTWYSQIMNREKKAMDFAQTFAKRNALKHLSGLQKAPSNNWNITVLCWRPTNGNIVKWDATQYSQLQDRVNGVIEGNRQEFQGQQIEMSQGAEDAAENNDLAGLEQSVDPEDQTDVPQSEPINITPEPTKTEQQPEPAPDPKIRNNFMAMIDDWPTAYGDACDALGYDAGNPNAFNDEEMITIFNKVDKIIQA